MSAISSAAQSFHRNLLAWLIRQRGLDSRLVAALVIGGLVLLVTTVLMFRGLGGRTWTSSTNLQLLLLVDGCYLLVLTGLLALRIAVMMAARRAHSAGSTLRVHFAFAFVLVAVLPAVVISVFAVLTVNFGLEKWSSDRVVAVIENSVVVAEAYKREHTEAIQRDAIEIGALLNSAAQRGRQDLLGEVLVRESQSRDIARTYIVSGAGAILLQGANSRHYNFIPPGAEMLRRATAGEPLTLFDSDNAEIRAMFPLTQVPNGYLYLARTVDSTALRHADSTRQTARVYAQLESERQQVLFSFGLLYLCVAVFITLLAMFVGFWFADRMVAPIGRLAHAVRRVGSGDLSVRVQVESDQNEIAELSRVFNQMTEQVGQQQDRLVKAHDEVALRMQFIEQVLAGVPAGIIGVDAKGQVEIVNQAAGEILNRPQVSQLGAPIVEAFPEINPALTAAMQNPWRVAEGTAEILVAGKPRHLILRVAAEHVEQELRGFVVTFVDITDRANAERLAAWGDLARRVAHEIKNPLTPMRLAVEQLHDTVKVHDKEDRGRLDKYSSIIVTQIDAILNLLAQFSRLAQSSKPELKEANLGDVVEDAVALETAANSDIQYDVVIPQAITANFDRNQISGAVTNLLQNAAWAVRERDMNRHDDAESAAMVIAVRVGADAREAWVEVEDNGIGLPAEDPHVLLEPYHSTRKDSDGHGLGLAIVHKTIEAHGGSIHLLDAPSGTGALIRLQFPIAMGMSPTPTPMDTNRGGQR